MAGGRIPCLLAEDRLATFATVLPRTMRFKRSVAGNEKLDEAKAKPCLSRLSLSSSKLRITQEFRSSLGLPQPV